MTTRGDDENYSRSKINGERHQSVALRFSTAVCTSHDSLNNPSLILFFHFFTLCSLFLVRHVFDERKCKILNARQDDAKCVKKERNERTSEPPSFCLYSSYSRRTNVCTYIYIFSFPNDRIQFVVTERRTLCLCSQIRPVRSFS